MRGIRTRAGALIPAEVVKLIPRKDSERHSCRFAQPAGNCCIRVRTDTLSLQPLRTPPRSFVICPCSAVNSRMEKLRLFNPPLCSKSTAQERRRSETSHLAESHRVRTCSADDTVCVRRSDDFRPAFHCQL